MNLNEHKHVIKHSAKMLGAVLLSSALLAGCTSAPAAQPAAQTAEPALKVVKTAAIEKKSIGDPLEQVADVVSSIQMDVVTKVSGDVQEIVKKRGEMVQKGDVILRLDPTDIQLQKDKNVLGAKSASQQLDKAREELSDSKVDLQNAVTKGEQAVKDAEKNYAKMRNDFDQGLVTKFQLDQLETQLNNARLDLESTKNKLKTLETTNSLAQLQTQLESSNLSVREADRSLNNMEIKAQVNGVITDLPVEVGMTLPAGFKAAQVQQLDPIKIKAELTEESAKLIRGKSELMFYIPGSAEKLKGTVSYLADVMSTQTKSYPLELEIPNADTKLKPGMKVQILLTDEKDEIVVTVPTLSVVREGGDTYVFVLNGDTAEKRKVQLGRLNETNQEVLSGVKEGEQLVISGQNQLKDKEKVKLTQ
ncbi:efflux RND transporter periplasmic adaptor subunit [Paenibacillus sp. TAB 01]|uniref:efflux RND transporter periplasmic adaptor subunit n=1 Tax=Paenibacillus sp. TAB 01 TaxID=3368988 RepID=UPI003751F441